MGVDKRIDVLATAIYANLTVDDLTNLELAYSPQYGAAKDPVNIAGYVAANYLHGEEDFIAPDEVEGSGQKVLDVRENGEFDCGHIPNSINIPLGQLRDRLNELPKETLAVCCGVGQRAYYATRILRQRGFRASNVMGGFNTYMLYNNKSTDAQTNVGSKTGGNKEEEMASCQCDGKPVCASEFEELDLRGLQCPGPIAALSQKAKSLKPGSVLKVMASDPGFPADIRAWCSQGGHELMKCEMNEVGLVAEICLHAKQKSANDEMSKTNQKTIVVFSGDLDRVLAAFVLANAAADMGDKVTLFFTFWGLNALRRSENVAVSKGFIDRMFGYMMPRGPDKLKLSKMNMAGMGTAMMKKVMHDKGVDSLPIMIENAQKKGVRLIACSMTLDVMGLKSDELLEGVEVGGAAAFLAEASKSNTTLFDTIKKWVPIRNNPGITKIMKFDVRSGEWKDSVKFRAVRPLGESSDS